VAGSVELLYGAPDGTLETPTGYQDAVLVTPRVDLAEIEDGTVYLAP
jgi:hypothetical protein